MVPNMAVTTTKLSTMAQEKVRSRNSDSCRSGSRAWS